MQDLNSKVAYRGGKITIISDNFKFIYIHIPKCGGSSIEREFETFAKWGDFVIGSTRLGYNLEKVLYKLYGIDKHTKPKQLAEIIGNKWDEYTKVTIVRHPKKVIESYYKFGKRRASEICTNNGLTRSQLLHHIKLKKATIPDWMYHQNRGAMIDAISSDDFNHYLKLVSDTRWTEFFNDYVLDQKIDYVLQLEESEQILDFFRCLVDDDFKLRHENISNSSKELVWSDENLEIYSKLISEVCDKLGYGLDYD